MRIQRLAANAGGPNFQYRFRVVNASDINAFALPGGPIYLNRGIIDSARNEGGDWIFELPQSGPEPLLRALIDGGAGIETLAIERPGLHEAFVAIAGDAAAQAMDEPEEVAP